MQDSKPFSIAAVIAVRDAARYLPELLASLTAQTVRPELVQFVFVDDGSTDGSGGLLDEWASRRRESASVVHQAHSGVSSARNTGLERVDARWVTFPDADDVLDPRYFEEAIKFLYLHDRPDIALAASLQSTIDDLGTVTDQPLYRPRFDRGSTVVDLELDPLIQPHVTSAFLRTAVIHDLGLEFDARVAPTFGDAHFIARYLLGSGTHRLGLMASAKYLHRMRADGSSVTERSHAMPAKYTDVLRHGLLDLVGSQVAGGWRAREGNPRWLENLVLYELVGYFRRERFIKSPSASAPAEVFDEFHRLAAEILRAVGDDAIRSFSLLPVDYMLRHTLLKSYRNDRVLPDNVVLAGVDETLQLVLLSYWFTGELPEEDFEVDGEPTAPIYETVQEFEFYGRSLTRRRRVWLPRGQATSVSLDGSPISIGRGLPSFLPQILNKKTIDLQVLSQRRKTEDRLAVDETLATYARRRLSEVRRNAREALAHTGLLERRVQWAIHLPKVKARYAHAWVFMDRDTDANDNGEHLYRYVLRNHPEINSYFVLNRDSRDWDRLEAEGFRLVDYRSFEWHLLILSAEHLASSHIADYVTKPLDPATFGAPRFHFTFLQHGVINYDLSRWLNSKRPDVFVVSTPQEHRAIAGWGPYVFTPKEVALTGLPRFDRLLEKRAEVPESARDLIVVMPTWRQYLVGAAVKDSGQWEKDPAFMASRFAAEYTDLLSSDALKSLAERTGKTVAFMPHPLLRPYLPDFHLPPHVKVLDFATDGVQDVLAHAATFVTDFSSLAFDAAFITVPTVYFHFDLAEFFGGSHSGRRGYFRYDEDGFGPVADSVEQVVDAISGIAERGYRSSDLYERRAEETFVERDGKNCERVLIAMRALTESSAPSPTSDPASASGTGPLGVDVQSVDGLSRRAIS